MSTYLQIINCVLFNCRTELVIYLVNSFFKVIWGSLFGKKGNTKMMCVCQCYLWCYLQVMCMVPLYYIFSLYILYRQKLFAFERFITYLYSVLSFTCYVLIAQSGGTSLATHFTMLFHCYNLLAYHLVALLKN